MFALQSIPIKTSDKFTIDVQITSPDLIQDNIFTNALRQSEKAIWKKCKSNKHL